MITFLKEGNIFDANVEALVNPVNCVGVMGKGLALQFKKAYPGNFELYKKLCNSKQLNPGGLFIYWNEPTNDWIINFATKRHWHNPSELEWINEGLISLKKAILDKGIKSIAIPALGAGLGKLKWSDVRSSIEKELTTEELEDVNILIYEPQ